MRVLIVEDDPVQRRVLCLVVGQRGHEVVACASCAEAMAAGPCDVAFVDRGLPDGDGLALARSLSGKVYLLTGDDGVAEESGLAVLLKPVRPAQLEALLAS